MYRNGAGGGDDVSCRGKRMYCFCCGHRWTTRSMNPPKVCPRCHRSRYDVPTGEYTCSNCSSSWMPEGIDDICPNCAEPITPYRENDSYECIKCGYQWVSRAGHSPVRCPKCNSRNWDRPEPFHHVCRRCGNVWASRIEAPQRCPSCLSTKWNSTTYKLKCFHCGYRWKLSEGVDPDRVAACPSCRSKSWNEFPKSAGCSSCGRTFIPAGRSRTCPSCRGWEAEDMRCGFCGTEWISAASGTVVCPGCGYLVNDRSERLVTLWEERGYRLNYLFKDSIGCIYLWKGGYPETCVYLEVLLRGIGMSSSRFFELAGCAESRDFWIGLMERMHEHRDRYLKDVLYFCGRLGINREESIVLSLHVLGMSPEAISIREGMPIRGIRRMFTRIQGAFADSGIVVNDSVFTDDPREFYGD